MEIRMYYCFNDRIGGSKSRIRSIVIACSGNYVNWADRAITQAMRSSQHKILADDGASAKYRIMLNIL